MRDDSGNNPDQVRSRLFEIAIALATLGLVVSVAVPALHDSKRVGRIEAAGDALLSLRETLNAHAQHTGAYPSWGQLNLETLEPMAPYHLADASKILASFEGGRLEFYLPWDPQTPTETLSGETRRPTFFVSARLAEEPHTRFMLTPRQLQYWDGQTWRTFQE